MRLTLVSLKHDPPSVVLSTPSFGERRDGSADWTSISFAEDFAGPSRAPGPKELVVGKRYAFECKIVSCNEGEPPGLAYLSHRKVPAR